MMLQVRRSAKTLSSGPLATAERFSAVTQLLSSLEYLKSRSDREPGGLNDWTYLRSQVPAKMKVAQALRDFVARERVTQALHVTRALAAVVLISPVRNNKVRLSANAYLAGTENLIFVRHLFGTDGSDQVAFLVQTAATLGRLGGTATTRDAAVQFIGAQTVLSYGASGWAKLPGPAWQSGDALAKILRTRTYGDERLFNLLKRYPRASRMLCHSVVAMEAGFPLLLLKRGKYIDGGLIVMGLFHLINARVMGLSRFAWAFLSTYPSVRALAKGTSEADPNKMRFSRITAGGLAACLVAGVAHQLYATAKSGTAHAGFERRQVRCGSGNLVTYYLRRGRAGGPIVVCESGLMSTSTGWLLLADNLDPAISVLVYDRAGYRNSLRSCPEDYSLSESVSDLSDVIADGVRDASPCVLVGHSLGGYLAHRAAAALPQQVHGLVLVDPMHPRQLMHSRKRREGARGLDLMMRLGAGTTMFGGGLLLDKKEMYSSVEGSPHARALRLETSTPSTWRAARREWRYCYSFMLDGGRPLDQLDIPVTVVASGATMGDGADNSELYEEYIATGSTGGRIVTIPEAGHQSVIDGPDFAPRTARVIEDVVGRLLMAQARAAEEGGAA